MSKPYVWQTVETSRTELEVRVHGVTRSGVAVELVLGKVRADEIAFVRAISVNVAGDPKDLLYYPFQLIEHGGGELFVKYPPNETGD